MIFFDVYTEFTNLDRGNYCAIMMDCNLDTGGVNVTLTENLKRGEEPKFVSLLIF